MKLFGRDAAFGMPYFASICRANVLLRRGQPIDDALVESVPKPAQDPASLFFSFGIEPSTKRMNGDRPPPAACSKNLHEFGANLIGQNRIVKPHLRNAGYSPEPPAGDPKDIDVFDGMAHADTRGRLRHTYKKPAEHSRTFMTRDDSGKRVLVIDDDGEIRRLVSAILGTHGFSVDEANGGREGIEMIGRAAYDAIVLDLMMPHVSGFDVLEVIRKSRPESKCVIVISAATPDAINRTDPTIVRAALRKPFNIEELVNAVRMCTR